MEISLFSEISLIIAIGTFIGLIMHLLKQPLIISHIVTGVVVGPSVLNLVQSEDTIQVFATFGIALLLFIIGLGLNPKVIKELGHASAITGFIQISLITLLGWGAMLLMGFSQQQSWLVGLALAFSSTIIILKLLSDKKEQTRLYGKLAIGLLLVQDIVATVALIGIASFAEGGLIIGDLTALTIKGLLVAGGLTWFSLKLRPHIDKIVADSQEFLFLFALGWGLGIASLFEMLGFSVEVGALFAGVSIASAPYAQEIGARLRPLRDFFIVLFFIMLGAQFDIFNVGSMLLPALMLSAIVVIIKPLIVMLILGFLGYTKSTSFKAGLTMAQISEFSLVFIILAAEHGKIGQDIITLITLVAFISIGISTYLILYADKLYGLLESRLRLFEHRKVAYDQEAASRYTMILFGYKKGGSEFLKLFHSIGKPYVVVDYDPEVIDILEHRKEHYIYGDATDLELLEEAGVAKAKLIISTITDHQINLLLVEQIHKLNPRAVLLCHSDNAREAADLYQAGATYVMMPHYIGSEKISSFIKRNGFKKSEFNKFRQKHLEYLQSHIE